MIIRTILFLHLILLCTPMVRAQVDTSKVYELFDLQEAPKFPGGEAELHKFLGKSIRYPALARENSIQGSVIIQFILDEKGKTSNVVILKDIGAGCGKEAVRVIRTMPLWTPGKVNGAAVKTKYTLPIRFRLEDDEELLVKTYTNQEVDVKPVCEKGDLAKTSQWVEQEVRSKKKKATVRMLVTVDHTGQIYALMLQESEKDLGNKCAVKFKESGKWRPGLKEGKPVNTSFEVDLKLSKKKKK